MNSVVGIGFNQVQYANIESNLDIPVIIQKTGVRLAQSVTLKVQPMTIADAMTMGVSIPLVEGVDITINNTKERMQVPVRAKGMNMKVSNGHKYDSIHFTNLKIHLPINKCNLLQFISKLRCTIASFPGFLFSFFNCLHV